MKGLLIKDRKTLLKQMKVMLAITALLACVPSTYMSAFALFYAAMLPITALAYDERAKWDELAAMMPYTAKAIVGSNAFAHESGIHQDGMLKNRETYEIMTPQSIGRKSTDLVIGKHSGRNAVRTRLEELGYRLDDEQVNVVFAAVKDLADKKANVHDEDLEALVFSEVYRLPDRYRLGNVSVQTTMGSSMPATAAVVIQAGEEEMRRAGFGAGPIDATFNVISQIVSRAPDLEQFSINAITGGTDAQGEVTVRLREGEYSATGRGSDPDIIVASAKAYIDALNRLDHKERDALRTQEATGEPAINTCN